VTIYSGIANAIAADGTNVYWTTMDGSVMKVPMSGGAPVTIASSSEAAGQIATDGAFVYWEAGGVLQKVAVDGGPVTTLATSFFPVALAVDGAGVYGLMEQDTWEPEVVGGQETNPPALVTKVPVGGGPATVVGTGSGHPLGQLAIDDDAVYWAEADDLYNRIMRASKGGGATTALYSEPSTGLDLEGPVVDATNVYWTTVNDGAVRSVPKGGGAATALTPGFGLSEDRRGVAVDATGVYWFGNDIQSILPGGGLVSWVATAKYAEAMVVGPTNVYWIDQVDGAVMTGPKAGVPVAAAGPVVGADGVDPGNGLGCEPSSRYVVIDPGFRGDVAYGPGPDVGLVEDTTTGLVWTRFLTGAGVDEIDCGQAYGASEVSAAAYCDQIGMRLPTELEALGVAADADPCVWPQSWSMWTSTFAGPGVAWNVSPTGETAQNVDDDDPTFGAICVSGTCSAGSCKCAPTGVACTADEQCCTHACQNGTCVCSAVGSQCASGADCCIATTCDTVGGGCACLPPGGACTATSDCCNGTCQGGKCACSALGDVCSADSLCCSGICGSGACSCNDAGAACTTDATCCSGSCTGGACACAAAGLPCTQPSDCCSGSCPNGTCECAPGGTACLSDALCCSGSCTGGACAP
jgi:hypothetical protein